MSLGSKYPTLSLYIYILWEANGNMLVLCSFKGPSFLCQEIWTQDNREKARDFQGLESQHCLKEGGGVGGSWEPLGTMVPCWEKPLKCATFHIDWWVFGGFNINLIDPVDFASVETAQKHSSHDGRLTVSRLKLLSEIFHEFKPQTSLQILNRSTKRRNPL